MAGDGLTWPPATNLHINEETVLWEGEESERPEPKRCLSINWNNVEDDDDNEIMKAYICLYTTHNGKTELTED